MPYFGQIGHCTLHRMTSKKAADNLRYFTVAFRMYLEEIEAMRSYCMKHSKTTAIHTRGHELQVYRMYESKGKTAQYIHEMLAPFPEWEESPYWFSHGESWLRLKEEVEIRVNRHSNQCHIACQGIIWNNEPMLVHVYKFDTDKYLKVELIIPTNHGFLPVLPLRRITDAIQVHEHLVPEFIAKPKPPYTGHEMKFISLSDYLSREMPKGLYASECFPCLSKNDS